MTDRENSIFSGNRRDGTSTQDGAIRQDDGRKRANQQAVSRPGVDAEHSVGSDVVVTSQPHEGSVFEPLRTDSAPDTGREAWQDQGLRTDQSGYSHQQGDGDNADSPEGVSHAGLPTQHGDAIREGQQVAGSGSVFQPLEADSRPSGDLSDKQRGNPGHQHEQGLNEGNRVRRDDDKPRGIAPNESQRHP